MSETITESIIQSLPHKVKDINLAEDGRKAIDIAVRDSKHRKELIESIRYVNKVIKSNFHIIEDAGHSMTEKGISSKLIEYTDKFSEL